MYILQLAELQTLFMKSTNFYDILHFLKELCITSIIQTFTVKCLIVFKFIINYSLEM